MKKIHFIWILTTLMFVSCGNDSTTNIGSTGYKEANKINDLKIDLKKIANGLVVSSIKNRDQELLYKESDLFSIGIRNLMTTRDTEIKSSNGWGDVKVINNNSYTKIVFSKPLDNTLPQNLQVTTRVAFSNKKSIWDLKVLGIGNGHSLVKAISPKLSLISLNDAKLLTPKYSGQLISNPASKNISYVMRYPTGWTTTMQFLAHYNQNGGLYFGFHDPLASTKNFVIDAKNGAIDISCNIPIPDESKPANDWNFPGVFELDLFDGDWYDASMIYKDWVEAEANYFPKMTNDRIARQSKIGEIAVWAYYSSSLAETMQKTTQNINQYIDYFEGIPVGVHWYQWNKQEFDDNYPNYFPQRTGMKNLVKHIQTNKNSYIMPYINGRLFDTDLPNYRQDGFTYATKDANNKILTQTFNNNIFAVMCPTQTNWQDRLVGISQTITESLGTAGIYLDQVAAAGPTKCMDKTHNHTLNGGHWWFDGYNQMFSKIHKNISRDKFVTVEGANDYIINQVDGFLTEGWTTNDLVPAFQAVYGGKVQLFGTKTGTGEYKEQSYYSKLSQAFVNGIQTGRTSSWLVADNRPNGGAEKARKFVKKLATMRYKLKEFLSFGSLQRAIKLDGNIPNLTSTWYDYGKAVDVTTAAIQSNVYRNRDNNEIAFIFVNASITQTIDFSYIIDGSKYGFLGKLNITDVTPNSKSQHTVIDNRFLHRVNLKPMEVVAFIIKE